MNSKTKPYYMHAVAEINNLSTGELKFEALDSVFREILEKVGINVVKSVHYEFPGGGLSMVYILSASHLAIHTWPESGFMHFDLITCSPQAEFEEFKTLLRKAYPKAEIMVSTLNY